MKRILVVAAFVGLLINPVGAQGNWEETRATPTRPHYFGFHRSGDSRGFAGWPGRVGIFPPGLTGHENKGFFLGHFLFSGYRPTSARPQPFSLFSDSYYGYPSYDYGPYGYSPYGYYPQLGSGPSLYDSQRFVDEWKDREPAKLLQARQNTISQSVLLSEGMSEEDVVKTIGSPLQKIKLGERTIWKYSGYSLLFEGDALKEIR